MKVLLFIQAVFAAVLPTVGYAYLPESIPFYAFDGVDYTCTFYLPATYFVAIEEEGEEYDRVTYLDLSGYVRHGDAERVDYDPASKYAESGKIELKRGIASVYLYADASCTSVLSPVTASDSLFLYGESSVQGVYYCRLRGGNGALRGYVSTEGVIVTLPKENDISAVPPHTNPDPSTPAPDDGIYESKLAFPVQLVLIISLAVPAFLLVFMLTKKKTKPVTPDKADRKPPEP